MRAKGKKGPPVERIENFLKKEERNRVKGNLKGGMKGRRFGKKRDRRAATGQRRWSSSSSFSHDKLKIPVNRFWLGRCSRHEPGKVARGGGKKKTLNQNNYPPQQKDKSWREFLSRVVTYPPHSGMLLVRLADNLADLTKCFFVCRWCPGLLRRYGLCVVKSGQNTVHSAAC